MQKCEKSMPVSPSRGHLDQKCPETVAGVPSRRDTWTQKCSRCPPCRDVTPASFHETQGNAGAVKIDTDDLNLYMLVQLQDF